MCEFSRDDVLAVAKAVIEDPYEYYSGDYPDEIWCRYCEAEVIGYNCKADEIIHSSNCPVLIAQDILTNNKEK